MGEMPVPHDALYGASTARAVQNFPIARRPIPREVIHAFGHLKAACAIANNRLGKLDEPKSRAIVGVSDEVARGLHDAHFPVDVYQTGSGTSSNMNANEVIARLATKLLGSTSPDSPAHDAIHPNDHVNMGQSSNDTFPTAMHIAAAVAIEGPLTAAMTRLFEALTEKSRAWDDVVKIGRTHLMDATPIRVGQVFGGYAHQIHNALERLSHAAGNVQELAIGGTAVGTGINTHARFAELVCEELRERLGLQFREAENHPEAQATRDSTVEAHAYLKTIAVSLSKIANDIRHLASGPRCGIFELSIPAIQPGSSIMPGKENPVLCESVMQVACRVIGNDATITMAALGGVGSIFELNVAMPVMIDAMMESINLLTNVTNVFVDKLLIPLRVNAERCESLVEQSLMMITPLAPVIGYDRAASVAKQAFATGRTIREIVIEQNILPIEEVDRLLHLRRMTEPD